MCLFLFCDMGSLFCPLAVSEFYSCTRCTSPMKFWGVNLWYIDPHHLHFLHVGPKIQLGINVKQLPTWCSQHCQHMFNAVQGCWTFASRLGWFELICHGVHEHRNITSGRLEVPGIALKIWCWNIIRGCNIYKVFGHTNTHISYMFVDLFYMVPNTKMMGLAPPKKTIIVQFCCSGSVMKKGLPSYVGILDHN